MYEKQITAPLERAVGSYLGLALMNRDSQRLDGGISASLTTRTRSHSRIKEVHKPRTCS